jgi:hypothetical protein
VIDPLKFAALLSDPARAAEVPLADVPLLLDALAVEEGRRRLLRELLTARLAVPAPLSAVVPTGEGDDLLTDEQVGQILGVPASTVADLRKAGDLPGVPVGQKYIRTRRVDVRDYVAKLPHATYSRRHDRRGGGGSAQAPQAHPSRACRAGGGCAE